MSVKPQVDSQLPQSELEICQRVRAVRHMKKWSQPSFAKELGITRDLLASYEYGRAPVRYWLGNKVCQLFNINQRWLRHGRNPMRGYVLVHPELEKQMAPRALFSEVYDLALNFRVETALEHIRAVSGRDIESIESVEDFAAFQPAIGTPMAGYVHHWISGFTAEKFRILPERLAGPYAKTLWDASEQFLKDHEGDMAADATVEAVAAGRIQYQPGNNLKFHLTSLGEPGIQADMRTAKAFLVDDLMLRLARMTAERGSQAALARELGVTPQAVSEWLSRKSAPSAELTLRLLNKVTAFEAQQKQRAAGALTPTAQTTKGTIHAKQSSRSQRKK